MHLDIRDERFSEIVSETAEREVLSEQFEFTEGPIWDPRDQALIFSDIPADTLYRWTEATGATVYRQPSHMTNGNTYDKNGRMLSCEHATSRVVRQEGDDWVVLASHYQGQELNSPNDIVVRSDGSIFFTDPTYGRLPGPHGLERPLQLDFRGVYQITPDGELHLLSKDFDMPNGLCLSLDERTLYVADTARAHVRQFTLSDHAVAGGEVFCQSPAPDGLKIDSAGYLYAGGPGGVGVYGHVCVFVSLYV